MRSTIKRRSLAGSWILFCALRKDHPKHAFFLAQLFEQVTIVRFQRIPVSRDEAWPVVTSRNGRRLVPWRFRALVGHLEEEQVRQLLNVVTIR